MAAAAATTAALATVPGPVPLLIVLAVAAGTVSDNLTLLPATAVTDCWETARYERTVAAGRPVEASPHTCRHTPLPSTR
jgi:hypothetical protein